MDRYLPPNSLVELIQKHGKCIGKRKISRGELNQKFPKSTFIVVSCVCLTGAIDEYAPKYPVLPNRFKRLFSLFQWK